MRRIFLLTVFCFACLMVGAQSVRLMSYNIHNGVGMDKVRDYDRLAKVIRQFHPDMVAIQELDSVTHRSKGDDVLDELAQRTKMRAFYAPAIDYDGGKYGIGILAKKKPVAIYRYSLPGREERRALICVEFKKMVFCCTHLSLTKADRMASLKIIQDVASRYKGLKPVFVAGDFNDVPDSPLVQGLLSDFQVLTDLSQPTFPAPAPKETIDYIVAQKDASKMFLVKEAVVVDEPVASDHRPVFVKVRVGKHLNP